MHPTALIYSAVVALVCVFTLFVFWPATYIPLPCHFFNLSVTHSLIHKHSFTSYACLLYILTDHDYPSFTVTTSWPALLNTIDFKHSLPTYLPATIMFRPSTFVSVLLGSLTIVGAAPVVEPPPAATPFRVSSKGDGLNRGPARELAHALARAGHDSAGIQKLRKRQNSRSSKFRDDDDSTNDSLDVVSSVLIGAVLPTTAPTLLSTRLPRKSATVSTTSTPIRSGSSPASADVSNIANSATAAATASVQQSASGNLVAKATATEAAGQDQYIETLTIGSQAHELHVVFDTGSTDL